MKILYLLLLICATQFSFAQIRFQNIPDPAHYPERTVAETLVATIAYQGYDETQAYFGQGEYELFLDTMDGVLDKPIVVLDGFDPGNTRGISDIYASLSFGGENLADILRSEGFDIVILNAPNYTTDGKLIDGGSDYIQRNAMVLIALIQQLNSQKEGNEELVVLGPSMGGLIGRYALAYMEENSLEAETRLFISLDAPHRGANIPIGLQYVINYFVEMVGDDTTQQLVNQLLDSPASKEMLVDHLYGHLLTGSTYEQDPSKLLPAGAPGFRNEFQAELDALGFPSNVRNVAIINGDGNGTTIGNPGMTIIDTTLPIDALTSADISLKFTPEAGQTNTVTDVSVSFLGIPVNSFQAIAQSTSLSDGVDSAPGGTASISAALGDGGGNPFLIGFINALQQDLYSFIPTMSSLAIDNPNWFASPNMSDSPFAAAYIPNENEPHVSMTAGSIQFALDEIRSGVIGIDENQYGSQIILSQNPVKSTINISILGSETVAELKTSVFNITGQKLMEQSWSQAKGDLRWNHNLPDGIYFLTLNNGVSLHTVKMIVK